MPPNPEHDTTGNAADLQVANLPDGAHSVALTGDWSTLGLAQRVMRFNRKLAQFAHHQPVSWDLCGLEKLDRIGALLLWRAWGRSFPERLVIPATLKEYFTRLPSGDVNATEPSPGTTPPSGAARGAARARSTRMARAAARDGATDRPPAARRHGSGSTPATLASARDLGRGLSRRRPGHGHLGAGGLSHRGRAELPVRRPAAQVRCRDVRSGLCSASRVCASWDHCWLRSWWPDAPARP